MAPKIKLTKDVLLAAAAHYGRQGGLKTAKGMSKAARIERARAAGKASGGWPKGKKRGPRAKKAVAK